MKDKPGKEDKEVQETSGLKTAGPEGEITAGMYICCVLYQFGQLLADLFVLSLVQLMPVTL